MTSSSKQHPLVDLEYLPGVKDSVQAASDAVAKVHRHPVNLRGWDVTGAEAVLRGARASALLDGGEIMIPKSGQVDDPILAGALRAAGELAPDGITETQITWRHAPLQVIARLNTLATPVEFNHLPGVGRPDTHSATRLQMLADLITSKHAASAVVLSAVVHGELLALAPFDYANGVTARAAARLTAVASGLDPRGLSVPEVWWSKNPQKYKAMSEAFSSGTPEGVAAWIMYHAQGLVEGAREGASIAEAKAG